jgi:ATP-binding cassette, subfamily B, beta-glucan exporter
MKVMLTGTDTLWWLWLGFFREHLAAIVSIAVLLPLSLYLNWRLGLLLIGLSLIFLVLTGFVLHKTETLQQSVGRYYSDLAERASDTLGNVALVQSFTRVEDEVRDLRQVVDCSAHRCRCSPGGRWFTTITKASTTLTMLAIMILGLFLFAQGKTTIGGIVMFMTFAGILIQRLEQAARFVNSVFMNVPRLEELFGVLDTTTSVKDRKNAVTFKEVRGEVAFESVTFSYDGKMPAVQDLTFKTEPGETIALVGATGAGKSTAMALLYRVYDPQAGKIRVDGRDIRDVKLVSLSAMSA